MFASTSSSCTVDSTNVALKSTSSSEEIWERQWESFIPVADICGRLAIRDTCQDRIHTCKQPFLSPCARCCSPPHLVLDARARPLVSTCVRTSLLHFRSLRTWTANDVIQLTVRRKEKATELRLDAQRTTDNCFPAPHSNTNMHMRHVTHTRVVEHRVRVISSPARPTSITLLICRSSTERNHQSESSCGIREELCSLHSRF